LVNKWDIYFCNLTPTLGSEQKGTRPVLIISNDAVNHNLPVSTVLPLSSVKKDDKIYPTEVLLPVEITNLPNISVAMIQQVRTVSHNRLLNKVGIMKNDIIKNQILIGLRDYFEY
jgi:mRNA interferase MazF